LKHFSHHIELYEQIVDQFLEKNLLPFPYEEYKFLELKRNSIWLTRNMRDSTSFRRALSKAKNLNQLQLELEKIFKV